MRHGYAVIDGGYGDSGKGLLTDYLARKTSADLNVRFNGGGQAGHTVVDGDYRHVFSHVGAATFAGSSTYLSSRFIVNPFVLHQESQQLKSWYPQITIHTSAQVTTVFDMVLNGLKELTRAENRHGSCGLGINETVTRSLNGYPLSVADIVGINSNGSFEDQLYNMYNKWFEPQLHKFRRVQDPLAQDLLATANLDKEIANLKRAADLFSVEPPNVGDETVFEGAQGLGLDEFLGKFPHVTRSITGLPSALLAASEIGVREISPVYVTRCYKTRHGAGPLLHEGEFITSRELTDLTNKEGRWQGKFRYAPLDVVELQELIVKDFKRSESVSQLLRIKVNKPTLALTCLDQVGDDLTYYYGQKRVGRENLIRSLNDICKVRYLSYGPSAKDVVEV